MISLPMAVPYGTDLHRQRCGRYDRGAGIVIEKGFQQGGDQIRKLGVHLESLAIISSMTDTSLTFKE